MHMHLPHGYDRLNERSQPFRELFWVLALGVLLIFGFFVVLGAVKPGDGDPAPRDGVLAVRGA